MGSFDGIISMIDSYNNKSPHPFRFFLFFSSRWSFGLEKEKKGRTPKSPACNKKYSYAMSILKSNNGNPDSCLRYTFAYENAAAGQGRFIHTYKCDGNPLPSFEGEPKLVEIPNDIDEFADLLWKSLNQDNKVSLFVRFIDIETGNYESRIVNKNK